MTRTFEVASFANRPVSLRVYADRLVVVAEAQVLAVQEKLEQKRQALVAKRENSRRTRHALDAYAQKK